jgi:hypothetical protein
LLNCKISKFLNKFINKFSLSEDRDHLLERKRPLQGQFHRATGPRTRIQAVQLQGEPDRRKRQQPGEVPLFQHRRQDHSQSYIIIITKNVSEFIFYI